MRFICIYTMILLLQAKGVSAQSMIPVDNGSAVSFSIRNFGLNVVGSLKGLEGSISFNPNDLAHASFMVSVDAASIDTDLESRDKHLRKEAYFNVIMYPKIRFISTNVREGDQPGFYYLSGRLQIKGKEKEVGFPFKVRNLEDGMLFTGELKINRRDFKIGGNSMVLSDNLTIQLSIKAKKNGGR